MHGCFAKPVQKMAGEPFLFVISVYVYKIKIKLQAALTREILYSPLEELSLKFYY
jgi:hypothetical protein